MKVNRVYRKPKGITKLFNTGTNTNDGNYISGFRNRFVNVIFKITFISAFFFISFFSFSQTDSPDEDNNSTLFGLTNIGLQDSIIIDSLKVSTEEIEKLALSGLQKSESNFKKNQFIQQQTKSFNQIDFEIQNANTRLAQGFDYADYTEELNAVINFKEVAVEGILVNEDKYLTLRNLTTTSLLLNEVLNRTENQLVEIKQNNLEFTEVQHRIDSLVSNEDIYVVPEDSAAKVIYYQRLVSMTKDVENLNAKLKNAIDSIQNLEILSNVFKYNLQSDIVKTEALQKLKYDRFFISTYKIFSERNTEEITFINSVIYSFVKELLLLIFYFINHKIPLVIMLLLIVAIAIYLRVLKGKYQRANIYNSFNFPVKIFKHPVATATLVSITIYQFFLPLPPFILSGILWIISGISLTILIRKTEQRFFYRVWLIFFVLSILTIFDHLILIHTITESWFILILSFLAFGTGIYTILNRKNFPSKAKLWIIIGTTVLELFAIIFLLLGNYNTGKIFMSEGIYTVIVGYFLINTFRLSKNIFDYSEFLKESDEEKSLDTLRNRPYKVSVLGFIFFIGAWLTLLTRNSYLFQKSAEPFKDLLSQTRQIGEFAFTFEGIIVFFLILVLSAFVSKIVSFLVDDKGSKAADSKSSRLGSWILLIRIGIIVAGIIVAFRSAGFPMDRLTMIISALGVGIGFGLQTLVNNLVSGLIIAFEKPINLDDVVEIGSQSGKMKSIGIRASVLATWDGADVIIPNGDLLNQHLVNWTMGSNKRRTEIEVGVAYNTDLEKAKALIFGVLEKNEQVLKYPPPQILFTKFNDSSIDILLRYWIGHFIFISDTKSNIIFAINDAFKENGIVIPFPQRDINIQSNTDSPEKENKAE